MKAHLFCEIDNNQLNIVSGGAGTPPLWTVKTGNRFADRLGTVYGANDYPAIVNNARTNGWTIHRVR